MIVSRGAPAHHRQKSCTWKSFGSSKAYWKSVMEKSGESEYTHIDGLQSKIVIERVVDHLGQVAAEVIL